MAAPRDPTGASGFPNSLHTPLPPPKRFPARSSAYKEQPSGQGGLGAAAGRWWLEAAGAVEKYLRDSGGSTLIWAGDSEARPVRATLRAPKKRAWGWEGGRPQKSDSAGGRERGAGLQRRDWAGADRPRPERG